MTRLALLMSFSIVTLALPAAAQDSLHPRQPEQLRPGYVDPNPSDYTVDLKTGEVVNKKTGQRYRVDLANKELVNEKTGQRISADKAVKIVTKFESEKKKFERSKNFDFKSKAATAGLPKLKNSDVNKAVKKGPPQPPPVAINPQPLPPKLSAVKTEIVKPPQPPAINPQPLPPKH